MKTILFLIFFILQSAPAFSYAIHIMTEDNINVRADSTVLSESLGTLKKGARIEVLEEKYGWLEIRVPEYFDCYISSDYIRMLSRDKGEILASNLNLRSRPSLDSHTIGKIQKNRIVEVIDKKNGWARISCYPYARGWVHNKFTEPIAESENLRHLVIKTLSELTVSDFNSKRRAQQKLIEMGKEAVTLVSTYLPAKDKDVNYSIIFVFTELAKKYPELTGYFFDKIDPSNAKLSGIYLDVIQNIIKPQNSKKKPYFYLAISDKLSATDIKEAAIYLKNIYKSNKP